MLDDFAEAFHRASGSAHLLCGSRRGKRFQPWPNRLGKFNMHDCMRETMIMSVSEADGRRFDSCLECIGTVHTYTKNKKVQDKTIKFQEVLLKTQI